VSDRCTCRQLETEIGSRNPTCPVDGDPDVIIASGRYVDRRGTWWGYMKGIDRWVDRAVTTDLTDDQMRRRIHRDRCPGLRECESHPVPHVWRAKPFWVAGDEEGGAGFPTLAEAIAAAHQMTGEKR
jgi:hypothetical protein